jgi:hypothetical protein
MTNNLNDEDYKKASDLKRIYGQKGLGDLLNINQEVVDLVLARNGNIEEKAAGRVKVGLRRYWQSWMGCREKSAAKPKKAPLSHTLTVPRMVLKVGGQ